MSRGSADVANSLLRVFFNEEPNLKFEIFLNSWNYGFLEDFWSIPTEFTQLIDSGLALVVLVSLGN